MKTNRKSHSPAVTYAVRRGAPLSSAYRNSAAVLPWMLCAATLIAAGPARAGGPLPTNGQYVAGQGSITSSGGSVTINQSSSHGIINWQGFSIGQGNSVLVWTIVAGDMPTLLHAP
jgi:hypothetical protein